MYRDTLQQNTLQISEEHLEELIQSYRRQLLVCAGQTTHRFITESDEEWSVTLLAFHEAVKQYDESAGPFWPFAATVIRRRLTDYLRKQYAEASVIPVEPSVLAGGDTGEPENRSGIENEIRDCMDQSAVSKNDWPGQYTVADEIAAVQDELKRYGFSFYDLTACSPKAEKSRKKCFQAIRAILQDRNLSARMRQAKALPMKELEKASGVSRKVLDKHRRYLIAATVILNGDYPLLSEYFRAVKEDRE